MKQYIDKDILATEIKRCIDDELQTIKKYTHPFYATEITRCNARIALLNQLQKFLDTLETRKENDNSLTSMDDRMRKAIIDFFSEPGRNQYILNEFSVDDIIAWLEKQVQKDAEKQKFLIENIRIAVEQSAVDYYNITKTLPFWYNDALDWLKKQGEQKSTDKVKAKFKVGDWIVNNDSGGVYQITEIRDDEYCLWPLYGEIMGYFRIIDIDNDYHPWTIADANDGDVLYSLDSNQPFIYKCRNNSEQATCYCGINKFGKFFIWNTKDCIITLDKYVPATLEQRDLLFRKMKEAGYLWDAENKQILSLKAEPTKEIKGNNGKISPKWTEEDERMMNFCISRIKDELESLRDNKFAHQEILQDFKDGCWERINWLKSIKQRIVQ